MVEGRCLCAFPFVTVIACLTVHLQRVFVCLSMSVLLRVCPCVCVFASSCNG